MIFALSDSFATLPRTRISAAYVEAPRQPCVASVHACVASGTGSPGPTGGTNRCGAHAERNPNHAPGRKRGPRNDVHARQRAGRVLERRLRVLQLLEPEIRPPETVEIRRVVGVDLERALDEI